MISGFVSALLTVLAVNAGFYHHVTYCELSAAGAVLNFCVFIREVVAR